MKLSDLPTLDAQRTSCAEPKPTKRDALLMKEAHRQLRSRQDAAWRKAVDARDARHGFVCRWSGKKLARTLELRPDRAERHHLESRTNRKTRWDVRNGFLCAYAVHLRLEAHTLQIVAGQAFTVDGRAYWDANHPLLIRDVETGERRWV